MKAALWDELVAPKRLELMTLLTAGSEVEFGVLRATLAISDSVLSKHVGTLEGAGLVRRRKSLHDRRRTTWIALTPEGRSALSAHVAALRALIERVD